ncbi:uncharacterized protein LOC118750538 [Rhagoletis pomonella]|uniref:uncharacterized protein LOC118750538 n=1 Tax=Rhagoletis pomonella TaxID=28610 RepID=UPI0017833AE9|nr:uncharacterized protein LOC118750538 [Rhagoletis pomonella]
MKTYTSTSTQKNHNFFFIKSFYDFCYFVKKIYVLDRGAIMAHHQTIRECKVVLTKVRHSVGRLTGEVENPIDVEIATTLPISTIDAAFDIEEKLTSGEYAEAMRTYLFKLKGANSSVDDVLRKILTEELLILFNFDGRDNKNALTKLKLVNEILFDVFQSEGRPTYEKILRKCVELSHNRWRQKKLLGNRSVTSHLNEQTIVY